MERPHGFTTYGVTFQRMTTGDWKRWSFTTIDGGNVPAEEVEAAKAQLDRRTFKTGVRGKFRESHWSRCSLLFRFQHFYRSGGHIHRPTLTGSRFQRRPTLRYMCSSFYTKAPLYVFDEIILTGGATTWDFAEEVTNRYGVERRISRLPRPNRICQKNIRSRLNGPHYPA